jgi:hypothetical protein
MKNKFSGSKLQINEFTNWALPQLLRVFNFPCTLTSPFRPKMESKLIAFSINHPSPEFLNPLINKSLLLGDPGFFFSYVDEHNDRILYPGTSGDEIYLQTWYLPYELKNEYLQNTYYSSHILFSSQGKWGIYMNHDDFLFLGGEEIIVNEIKLQKLELMVDEFIEDWKFKVERLNANIGWIPEILNHIYGSELARTILIRHNLENFSKNE